MLLRWAIRVPTHSISSPMQHTTLTAHTTLPVWAGGMTGFEGPMIAFDSLFSPFGGMADAILPPDLLIVHNVTKVLPDYGLEKLAYWWFLSA
jgi:hypothetical protein